MLSPARRLSILGGDKLLVRTPTPQEAYRHHIGNDEPVLEVRRESGGVEIHPAWHTEITIHGRGERS